MSNQQKAQPSKSNTYTTGLFSQETPSPGSQGYNQQYTENQGKTHVKESGYSNTQQVGGLTTSTSYQSTSKTTHGEPVITSKTSNYGLSGIQTNSNQGSNNKITTTEYSSYGANNGLIQGNPQYTQGYRQNITMPNNRISHTTTEYTTKSGVPTNTDNKLQSTIATTTTYGTSGNRIETSGINQQRNSQYGVSRQSLIEKGSYLVGEKEHEGRIVSETTGERRVIEIREGQQVTKSETVTLGETRIVKEVQMAGITRESKVQDMQRHTQEVEIVKRDKIIEVIKEIPVKVERYIDRIVDVYVDVPIERTIERERITEVVVEKPIEKIVEIRIEQIIEIPVEKIIEKPVEIQKFVEVPVERIINRPYDVFRENIIWTDRIVDCDEREIKNYKNAQVLDLVVDYQEKQKFIDRPIYVDNIISKEVRVPREVYIEVPKEKIVENKVRQVIDKPVPREQIITRIIEVPRENVIYKDVEFLTEKPVYVENLIEKSIPIERVVEREICVEVEHITEKPIYIDNIIHKTVEHIVQVPVAVEQIIEDEVEQIIENPIAIEQVIERPVEKIIRKSVPVIRQVQVPVEYIVEKLVERKVEINTEVVVNKYAEVPVEKIVEKPIYIERMVEVPKYIDRIIEVPVEKIIEKIKTVERIVEKPVYIETILEKEVEVIVEKIIEVPVEKLVEVEVEVLIETPVYEEYLTEEIINLEAEVGQHYDDRTQQNENIEHEDIELAQQIKLRTSEMEQLRAENNQLRTQYESFQSELQTIRSKISSHEEQENGRLKATIEELSTRVRVVNEQKTRLVRKSTQRNTVVETQIHKDPKIEELKTRIHQLILENQSLIYQITNKGEVVRQSMRRSAFANL